MVCAVSRERKISGEKPICDDRRALRRNSFFIEGKRPQPGPVLLPRVGHDIHQVAAIAQRPQLVESQKRGAGEIGFHTQHAVEFDRMPHRLMNLQPQLRAVEDDVVLALRSLIRLEQRDGFFAYPTRIFQQLQLADQFVSFVLPLPAIRIGIRPLLDFVSGKRMRRITRARP